jgi:predicted dehydrogenase
MAPLTVAVVGCGAIAQAIHVPVLAECERVRLEALVDAELGRARDLGTQYRVRRVLEDYRQIIGDVDAAIIAVPNHLHAPVATELLTAGIHVLVEKPMALSAAECDGMIEAAAKTGVVLAVGLVRRFYDSSQFVKQLLDAGLLGPITGFDLQEGAIFRHPLASDYMLRRDQAGGGVLTNTGVHVLDLLLWWLGGCSEVDYADDAMGGVEADCQVNLRMATGSSGVVQLSWIRDLANRCLIRGEKGTLTFDTGPYDPRIRLNLGDRAYTLAGRLERRTPIDPTFRDIYRRQLDDFLDAITLRRVPAVSGEEGRRSVALIEQCYASRQFLGQPWMSPVEAAR